MRANDSFGTLGIQEIYMSQEIKDFMAKMDGTFQAQAMQAHKEELLKKEMSSKEVVCGDHKQFLAALAR